MNVIYSFRMGMLVEKHKPVKVSPSIQYNPGYISNIQPNRVMTDVGSGICDKLLHTALKRAKETSSISIFVSLEVD